MAFKQPGLIACCPLLSVDRGNFILKITALETILMHASLGISSSASSAPIRYAGSAEDG
jgi:hypothetical protein